MLDNWGNTKIALPRTFQAFKLSILLITCASVIRELIHNNQIIVAYGDVRDLIEGTEATANK
jgi:hypothetical protein